MTKTNLAEIPPGPCVATLSYLYDQSVVPLSARLQRLRREHHRLTIAITHSHLGQGHCLETIMLRGQADQIQAFAELLMATCGVHHGSLNLMPVTWGDSTPPMQHSGPRVLM